MTPKITEILGFNLPVDMIATSHGVVWRDNPTQIVEKYLEWAADYRKIVSPSSTTPCPITPA